jgi:hypothetical protein
VKSTTRLVVAELYGGRGQSVCPWTCRKRRVSRLNNLVYLWRMVNRHHEYGRDETAAQMLGRRVDTVPLPSRVGVTDKHPLSRESN